MTPTADQIWLLGALASLVSFVAGSVWAGRQTRREIEVELAPEAAKVRKLSEHLAELSRERQIFPGEVLIGLRETVVKGRIVRSEVTAHGGFRAEVEAALPSLLSGPSQVDPTVTPQYIRDLAKWPAPSGVAAAAANRFKQQERIDLLEQFLQRDDMREGIAKLLATEITPPAEKLPAPEKPTKEQQKALREAEAAAEAELKLAPGGES